MGVEDVLVGANTCGLKSLRAQLFVLVGNEVDAEGKVIDTGALAAKIEDANLRVGYTTVETRLRVWLQNCSLAIIAPGQFCFRLATDIRWLEKCDRTVSDHRLRSRKFALTLFLQ